MNYSIFKVITELRNDFRGKKFTVHKVGFPEESDMPSLDMRVSTVTTYVCRLNADIITFFFKVRYLNNNILLIDHIIVPSVHEVLVLVFYIYLW